MNSFHEETGSWPDEKAWKEQLRPYSRNFGGASAPYATILMDPWGNEVKYVITQGGESTRPRIYSFGPNGKDDMGKNDDIVVEVTPLTRDEKQQ